MKNRNPYWYKLIKLLKSEGEITTGLTIPYLFGAYKELDSPFESISDLIEEILNNAIDKYPLIQKCPEIHKHVVMVEQKENCNRYYRNFVKIPNVPNDNFLYISSNTKLGKSIDRVCFELKSQYSKPIKNSKFSWDNTNLNWVEFSESQRAMILSIK